MRKNSRIPHSSHNKWNRFSDAKWYGWMGYVLWGDHISYSRYLGDPSQPLNSSQSRLFLDVKRIRNLSFLNHSNKLQSIEDSVRFYQQVGHYLTNITTTGKSNMLQQNQNNHISATRIFDHFLRTNVQIGIADIFEMEALKNRHDLVTVFRTAQVGIVDEFNYAKIVQELNDVFHIVTHESRGHQSIDAYLYYYAIPETGQEADTLLGITLINTTYDKTRATTIVLKDSADKITEVIDKHIVDDHHPCFVLSLTDSGIEETRRSISKTNAQVCHDAFYPFLGMSVERYFDNFLQSKEGILLLIGPAGTGKSTFIRSLILHSMKAGCMIYDEDTMSNLASLTHFYNSTHGILAMEDADNLLGRREEGNRHLAGMLNFADGIVNDPRKKMIIATNLSSTDRIDPALIRKGRCYDVINFRALYPSEANEARVAVGLEERSFERELVLAEALDEHTETLTKNRQRNFGFTPQS